jgi:hypothetical protein
MQRKDMKSLMDAYNQVILGESLEIDEARQMKDPKKDSMVQKGGKTIVIDKSKEKEYLKKGWELAEKKKLDPVDDAENDKKFKDRKDKDIDNDGDVDSSDEYLHKKRKATDDAIDGGKKPAKKEDDEEGDDEEEKETPKVAGKKDDKKKVASNAKTAEISKIGEDIDLTDATTDLHKMWESAAKKSVKGATDTGEEIDSKDSPKSKEFTAAHKKSDKKIEDNEEDGHDKTFKAQGGTTPKSGKRPQDNAAGDTKIVKSTEVKEEVEVLEEKRKLVTIGGTSKTGGEYYMGDAGIKKLVDLSKKNPNIEYTVKSDNYGDFKAHWLKNGKFAKQTVANINFDMDKNAVRGVPKGKTVKDTIFVVRYNVNEDTTADVVAQAQDIINGKTVSEIADLSSDKPKNPHDARTREARAFLERMAKRRGYK